MTDSRKIGSLVLAAVGISDRHLDALICVANNLNKQQPERAVVMAGLLEQALTSLEVKAKPIAEAVNTLLEEMKPVTVMVDQTINNFSEYLKTSGATETTEALWVDSGFEKILAKATSKAPASVIMKPYQLKENANDLEIKSELPSLHEIEPNEFVSMLTAELAKVRTGKHSNVLAKNRWCLFYVDGFAVSVDWLSDDSKWSVDVWEFDDLYQWDAERVVFSCN
jgi:hypothetical protein